VNRRTAQKNYERDRGEDGRAQIDCGGIESIDGLVDVDIKIFIDIGSASNMNQGLGKIGVDAPIPVFVGVGQCASGNLSSNAHMVKLGILSTQTGLDVPEAFSLSQLCESHA
jgi:hypothetical protein